MNLMEVAFTVLISVISSSAVAGLISFQTNRRALIWEAKRTVCLEALELVTAAMANLDWFDIPSGEPVPALRQPAPSIADLRRVHNQLAVYCRRPEVVETYLRCFDDDTTADRLEHFRNAIRLECGFRKKLPRDPSSSLLGSVRGTAEELELLQDRDPSTDD